MSKLARLAGPSLIVASVLLVMHDFAFGGRVTAQHPDLLALWMPNGCFLGDVLASGHVPAWNPFAMGGAPFAADPQSGWLYAPMMSLFTALPCSTALRWFIIAQPLIAGLGTYAFLRSEGAGRMSSTVGGTTIAVLLAGSRLGLSMPLAGALAWSTVTLAAVSRFVRAEATVRRLAWLVITALCWGQIAGAHLSNGLVVGTAALILYLVAAGRVGMNPARTRYAMWVIALLVALPLINAAILLPRLTHLPDTSATLGYEVLEPGGGEGVSLPVSWYLALARTPGAYLGWSMLLLGFAALWSRRWRRLAGALIGLGVTSYLLALEPIASAVGPLVDRIPLGDFYSHRPNRFVYGVVLVIPIVGAMGLETFLHAPRKDRFRMLVPGIALFLIPALLVGGPGTPMVLLAGSIAGVALLWWLGTRARWTALLPVVVAMELVAAAVVGSGQGESTAFNNRAGLAAVYEPSITANDYLAPTPLALEIRSSGARYLSNAPELFDEDDTIPGYLDFQAPEHWGLLANQRGMLFSLGDVQAVTSPVQLRRYWRYARAIDPIDRRYNATFFSRPLDPVMDLFAVRWIVAHEGSEGGDRGGDPGANLDPSLSADGWSLFDRGARPLATLHGSWKVVGSERAALEVVAGPGFDQERELVLEDEPEIAPTGAKGMVTAQLRWPDGPRFEVTTDKDALLLVRIPYDDDWHARVDGREVDPVPADHVMQAIPVPAGNHEIELRYDDPAIRAGLLLSAAVLAILAAIVAGLSIRPRRSTLT